MTVYKVVIRLHFFFLYVVLYSVFRNSNPFVEPSEITNTLLGYMVTGMFVWFVTASIFLFLRQYAEKWDRGDYLSPYVVACAVIVIAVLEHAIY